MFKIFSPILLITAAGLVWGGAKGTLAAMAILVLLAMWGLRRWLYVTVPELETAVVYRINGGTFARFLGPGRHWLIPFVERLGESIPTSPGMVNGQCVNGETSGGIPLTIDWSLSYKLKPFQIPVDLRPKLARSLPRKAGTIARNHVNNCLRHIISQYSVAEVSRPGMLKRLEREMRQQASARLAKLGYEISRVMLGEMTMPPQVRTALVEVYEQQVRIQQEAQSLARLHQVVSQFSETEMARLMELERIYKLGQSEVTILYQAGVFPTPAPAMSTSEPNGSGRGYARQPNASFNFGVNPPNLRPD